MNPRYAVTATPADGNAFSILSAVRQALREMERTGEAPAGTVQEYLQEAQAGDYDHLIQTSMRYVDLQPSD